VNRLDQLRALQRLLDSAFRVPGTNIRFGWDAIVGLVPWAGDAVTALVACVFIAHAFRMRLPRIVQLRILINIAIDVLLGLVPFAGDVADVFWKANARNMALLERHAAHPQPARASDWLFVLGIAAAVAVLVAAPFFVVYWIVVTLGGSLGR
jgi:hypothetical protein